MFCILIGAKSVYAQAPKEKLISTKISCISLDGNIKDLKFISDGKVKDIDIYVGTRSETISYQGIKQLTFFREGAAPGPNQPPVRIPMGRVVLDSKESRYLLFFSKGGGNQENYAIHALPDSMDKFKVGSYRYLNLAPYKVALEIGDTKAMLAAKNVPDVKGDFSHGKYYPTMMVSLPEGSEPIASYSGRTYYNENMRMLYIITPRASGRLGKISITGVSEKIGGLVH